VRDFFKMVFASAIGYIIGSIVVMFFSVILFAVIVGGVIAVNHTKDLSTESIRDKSILYVNVEGLIRERRTTTDFVRDMLSEDNPKEIGLLEMEETLKEAAKDKNILGVYLRLRYVSGGWAKLESFRKLLKNFKKSGKFIYAYSESYDEKLYYLASVASEIFMYPKGEFEWNGIYSKSMFFKKTLEKLEVEPTLIRVGRFKSFGEMITREKMSDENRYQLNELTTSLWKTILAEIVEDRKGLNADQLNLLASKLEISNAQQAFNAKFVTELLPIEEVEKKLRKATGVKADEEPRLISWSFYNEATTGRSLIHDKNKVAVIIAQGEIQLGNGSSNEAIYSDEMSGLIRDLAKDKDVKAVVLRIDSPGGSALASDVIWRSLEYLKKKKKLVSSFSDVAASGGYYIAAGSDYIYAEPNTVTGSIGVFGIVMNTEKFFDHKLGVTFDQVKTHESADMMTGRALTPFEIQKIQFEVNDIYKTFVNVVRNGRKPLSVEGAVEEIAEGRVWAGGRAKEIGLVDQLGSLEDAINKAASLANLKKYEVVIYPQEKKFIDRILASMGNVITLPTWAKSLFMSPQTKLNEHIYTRIPYNLEF
jgi:protease IV